MVLLEEYGVDLSGKHAVVLGRSDTVGSLVSYLLKERKRHSHSMPLGYEESTGFRQAGRRFGFRDWESTIREGRVAKTLRSLPGVVEREEGYRVSIYDQIMSNNKS